LRWVGLVEFEFEESCFAMKVACSRETMSSDNDEFGSSIMEMKKDHLFSEILRNKVTKYKRVCLCCGF
jgi:hypothetical protein